MNSWKAVIKKKPEDKRPEKWTPVKVHGVDTNGVEPLLLGFLWDKKIIGLPTHIVTKMPGYSWYYNQYHPMQYSGVAVNIYTIHAFMEFDDRWEFEVDLPWSEEFQKPRKGK